MIIVLLLTIVFSGCTSKDANVRIVSSVKIDESEYIAPYPYNPDYDATWINYKITFDVKDINGVGSKITVQVDLYFYNDETGEWEEGNSAKQFDRTSFYIDAGDITTITLNVDALKPDTSYPHYDYENRKIKIRVWTTAGLTESYEEELL